MTPCIKRHEQSVAVEYVDIVFDHIAIPMKWTSRKERSEKIAIE
jgi:hypothetical protein